MVCSANDHKVNKLVACDLFLYLHRHNIAGASSASYINFLLYEAQENSRWKFPICEKTYLF